MARIQPPARREGEGIWKPKPVPSGSLTPVWAASAFSAPACACCPQENFLFFGDSANAPYGEKSLDQVRALTLSAVDRLLEQGVKGIVVACNTATSAAIGLLRQLHPGLPIIGIEPAVKPAALAAGSSSVIVMATPLTIREDKYQKLAAAFCGHANVISLPCKGLAEMVERGIFDGPVLDAYLQDLLLPFRYCNIDYIVLGCTHYPFVRKAIARNFGRPVSIIDGSEGTAGSFAASWRPRLF